MKIIFIIINQIKNIILINKLIFQFKKYINFIYVTIIQLKKKKI